MKKRLLALILTIVMIPCTIISASASDVLFPSNPTDLKSTMVPYASAYLDDYSISFGSRDNCRMVVTMDVNGVRTMSKIGCQLLIIEHKVNGVWYEYDTLLGIENPDFYMYDTPSYLGSYSFYGEEGVQYRASMIAFAQDSTGYDTGELITSYVATCRE